METKYSSSAWRWVKIWLMATMGASGRSRSVRPSEGRVVQRVERGGGVQSGFKGRRRRGDTKVQKRKRVGLRRVVSWACAGERGAGASNDDGERP